MNVSISKQVAINQLYKIPLEVLDIVKSYLWYDLQTAAVRKNKANVRDQISISISAFNCGEDVCQTYWYFGSYKLKNGEKTEFRVQGFCCGLCGNYIQTMLSIVPEAVTCNCTENYNDDNFFNNEEIEDGEPEPEPEWSMNFVEDDNPELGLFH